MKPISSHFFASLFCWNKIFSFKTVPILAGLRSAESQNPWLPTQLQICRRNPPEGWLSVALLAFFEYKCHSNDHAFIFALCFHLTAHKLVLPSCGVLPRRCQEVRYDCIIRYRSQPQPAPLAWYWFLKLVQEAWNCPCSEFHRRSVFICQENIHALLSRVSSASLSDHLSACLCYVHTSEAWLFSVSIKYLFTCSLLWCFFICSVQMQCIYSDNLVLIRSVLYKDSARQ